jgi:hypothetical protein
MPVDFSIARFPVCTHFHHLVSLCASVVNKY